MPLIHRRFLLLCTALASSCGTARDSGEPGLEARASAEPGIAVELLASPKSDTALWPSWAASGDGRPTLFWTTPIGDAGNRLLSAGYEGEQPSAPVEVATGADWFVNWADFPAAARQGEMQLATWLAKSSPATYSYGVQFARSLDGGASWSAPRRLHSDESETEHGFVSLEPLGSGRFAAVWLDGRNTAPGGEHGTHDAQAGAMALYTAVVDASSEVTSETELDGRVCDCCQTATVLLSDGTLVVAYRDRSDAELRDVFFVRGRPGDPGSWSAPAPVAVDGWKIMGCPVNGPALATDGRRVGAAWFTLGRDEHPRVRVAFADTKTVAFGPPIEVSGAKPIGRVDLVYVDRDRWLVTWLESVADEAEWRAAIVSPVAGLLTSATIARGGGSRRDGFLRLAAQGTAVLAAWTDGATERLRVARLRLH